MPRLEKLSFTLLPVRLVTIHLQDRRGAASLRYRKRPESRVLCVNKSPNRYGFRAGTRTIRYGVDIVLLRLSNKNEASREPDISAKPLNSKSFQITE